MSSTTVGDVYATFYDPSLSKEPCCLSSAQWCRTRLIGSGSPDSPVSNVKVLAVDFGFTMTVPLTHVAPLPMECRGIPPQVMYHTMLISIEGHVLDLWCIPLCRPYRVS